MNAVEAAITNLVNARAAIFEAYVIEDGPMQVEPDVVNRGVSD